MEQQVQEGEEADIVVAPEKIVLKLVRNVKQNDCRTVVLSGGGSGGKGLLNEVRKMAANKLRISMSSLRLFDERGSELRDADKASAEAKIRNGGTFYVSAGEESCVTNKSTDSPHEKEEAGQSVSPGCGEVRIVAKESFVEAQAEKQLKWAASLKGVVLAVGLPDLHVGNSCPIGAAIATEQVIYPSLVGTDIGCGIMLVRTSLRASAAIKPRTLDRWAECVRIEGPWDGDISGALAEAGVETTSFDDSLGTIGRGNHFAELQVVERIEDEEQAAKLGLTHEDVYLCVHSGSRGFGESILEGHTRQFGSEGCFVESDGGQAYLAAHEQACKWAQVNRRIIARRMLEQLQASCVETLLDITHNNVVEVPSSSSHSPEVAGTAEHSSGKTSVWLHRKGAAPTDKGLVLIPGSRGAFSYLVKPAEQLPFGSSAWSLAHGAGRALARSTARSSAKSHQSSSGAADFKSARQVGHDLATTSLGSRVICEDKDLLFEERPEAYKDGACVVADLVSAELCTLVALMRPVLTYKMKQQQRSSRTPGLIASGNRKGLYVNPRKGFGNDSSD